MSFEWDANKDGINQQKHGISFDSACYVFEDLFAIIEYDEKHSVCEDRFCIIGKVFSFFCICNLYSTTRSYQDYKCTSCNKR
ncbi:MAG: BrnT family toxin [Spirochaetales bacterium]|nr:BrnT family toxin [Spirochaetales bacterium]